MSDSFVLGNQCDSIFISFNNWSVAEQGLKNNITNSIYALCLINVTQWKVSFLTETCSFTVDVFVLFDTSVLFTSDTFPLALITVES